MAPDAFQFFDGVSVRSVVVFQGLDELSTDFLYQANAVLLLITGQIHVAVMALLVNVVLVVAQVRCFTARTVMTGFPLNRVERAAADARQIMVSFADIVVNDTLGHILPVPERFHRGLAFAPFGSLFLRFRLSLFFALLLQLLHGIFGAMLRTAPAMIFECRSEFRPTYFAASLGSLCHVHPHIRLRQRESGRGGFLSSTSSALTVQVVKSWFKLRSTFTPRLRYLSISSSACWVVQS